MSAYSTDDYEFSFADRTIKNLEFIQRYVVAEKEKGKADSKITDAFEVTQLINSFVGLLIIPRQKCFKYMPDDIMFPSNSDAAKLFNKIIKEPDKCIDTYFEQKRNSETGKWESTNRREKITPKILVLRLRNAICHDNLVIRPLSPGKDGVITGIEFLDRKGKEERFKLILTIEETEILVKALSELLLSCYPK